ncbi:MAG TPA: TadE family protein [Bryobacteraceae bacterium]|jgi:Flp pilus assembly protein TadG|nr:TadE family protein [Bryobacteraceae bacterium]
MPQTGHIHDRSRRGSALLEFALLMSVLTSILFGIIDMSRMFYTCSAMTGAAEAGVGYGLLSSANNSNFTGMQQAALDDAGITGATAAATQFCTCPTGSAVSCAGSCSSGSVRLYLQVITQAPFSSFYPGFPSSISGKAVIRAK